MFRTKRQTEQNIPGSAKLTKDKLRKAYKRAAESSEQALQRKQQNREHMANFRANESSEQTFHRKQQQREHMAKIRAIESSEQTLRRQQASNSVQQAIETFLTVIRNGPDFVCTCCHRLMYRNSVVPCNPAKYTKCSDDLLRSVFSADLRYVCATDDEYVCKTCDRALKRGVMPLQAKTNGLQLCEILPELAMLKP